MDTKEINLNVLVKQYRKKGAAAQGYKAINLLIKKKEKTALRTLLRDHRMKGVYLDSEVEQRDNVDFLIDYFSILEIGLISGYIPDPLPKKIKNEAEFLLTNESVKTYFTDHYPLILPQLLLRQISIQQEGEYFEGRQDVDSIILFDHFLLLNQVVKKDDDIDQFLWLLDDGHTDGYSIHDFWNVLSDKNIIEYKLRSRKKHPLNCALWGFIKYIQFLSDYADLIRDSANDPILQSAFWHYQSYWFVNMKERLGSIFSVGIGNIRNAMTTINPGELVDDKNSYIDSPEGVISLQESGPQLNSVEEDINYLLNDQLGKPLLNYFNSLGAPKK